MRRFERWILALIRCRARAGREVLRKNLVCQVARLEATIADRQRVQGSLPLTWHADTAFLCGDLAAARVRLELEFPSDDVPRTKS